MIKGFSKLLELLINLKMKSTIDQLELAGSHWQNPKNQNSPNFNSQTASNLKSSLQVICTKITEAAGHYRNIKMLYPYWHGSSNKNSNILSQDSRFFYGMLCHKEPP